MRGKTIFYPLFIVILFSAILAGCGEKVANTSDTQPEDNQEETTRIYKDVTGREVEIPINPKRVLTTQYLDAMLALGVKPIGAPTHVLDNDYLGELQEGVEDIGSPFSIEKVLESAPDLIISADPEEVEQLSKIAPTVVIPWQYGDVYTQLNEVARILGKEKEADAWLANLNTKAAEGREKIAGDFGEDEVFSIFMTYGKDSLRLYGARNIGHVFYRLLELTPPPFIQEKLAKDPNFAEFVYDDISMEKLPDYAGDHIIMLAYDQETKDEGGMFYHIENSALWKNLAAVQNNKVNYIDDDPWFTYAPIAIEKSLDEAIELLSK
ncbi:MULTISPECIES: ABC transporter substrate-binding protein [Bacillaceae]|uniref:Fe3+-hydroxamate ABC transporter substrate-binding protein n=1 Tax=Domibacillus aminovorans TaxID=29332 RepID=A0A177KXE3_9BACI|nr:MULTISPECIES: ABC transporter substrate-binding protein [Bacillaceae]OAH57674.1 Fe3+-hydroxamate ABC transporter substrate-binding protein [Domibacillus aminovorans]